MELTAVSITRPVPRHELLSRLALTARDKAQRLERLRRDEDLLRGLLGDLLVRRVISRATGLDAGALVFAAGEFGKPRLVSRPGLEFNLSHSGAWVVCALDGSPVGVDVEQIRPVEPELSARFLSPAEERQLRSAAPASRLELFFALWTLKESYLKMTGEGLAAASSDFSVVASESGGFRVLAAGGPIEGVQLASSDRLAGHMLAACGRVRPPLESIEILPMEQLLAL